MEDQKRVVKKLKYADVEDVVDLNFSRVVRELIDEEFPQYRRNKKGKNKKKKSSACKTDE